MTEIKKTTTTTSTLTTTEPTAELNPIIDKDISVDTSQLDGMKGPPNPPRQPLGDDDPPTNTPSEPEDDDRTF